MSIDLINRNRNVGADIDRSNRVRLISSLNPYMAENPQALLAMAELPMELEDLAVNAVGTYGMMMGDNLALQMESMSSGAQRALWEQLPPARQQALTQLGYRRPDDRARRLALHDLQRRALERDALVVAEELVQAGDHVVHDGDRLGHP